MKSQNWGPFRQDWYSICSRHLEYRSDCDLCQSGVWLNHWIHICSHTFYILFPQTWKWWVNRK